MPQTLGEVLAQLRAEGIGDEFFSTCEFALGVAPAIGSAPRVLHSATRNWSCKGRADALAYGSKPIFTLADLEVWAGEICTECYSPEAVAELLCDPWDQLGQTYNALAYAKHCERVEVALREARTVTLAPALVRDGCRLGAGLVWPVDGEVGPRMHAALVPLRGRVTSDEHCKAALLERVRAEVGDVPIAESIVLVSTWGLGAISEEETALAADLMIAFGLATARGPFTALLPSYAGDFVRQALGQWVEIIRNPGTPEVCTLAVELWTGAVFEGAEGQLSDLAVALEAARGILSGVDAERRVG